MKPLGPIVGQVTDREACLWLRTERPERLACHVFRDAERRREVPASPNVLATRRASGCTGVTRIGLPRPGARYYYDIRDAAGASLLGAARGPFSFRAAPPPSAEESFCFALVSCHKPTATRDPDRRLALWRRLQRALRHNEARFVIHAGDQVYADAAFRGAMRSRDAGPRDVVRRYRKVYEEHWRHPDVGRVLAGHASYMIWDDHEIRNGWGSFVGDRTDAGRRRVFEGARQVYREFQHAHNPQPFGRRGMHYGFRHGACGFLVLDGRGARDVGRRGDPLLGRAQWRDIKRWIAEHATELRTLFVVSAVPVVHAPATIADLIPASDLRDHWSYRANRREQARLVRLLFDTANTFDVQVVLLGGDVHVGTVACIESSWPRHAERPRIYQFTSSPISNRPSGLFHRLLAGLNRTLRIDRRTVGRVLQVHGRRNFGLVRLDWSSRRREHRVRFELHLEGRSKPARFP